MCWLSNNLFKNISSAQGFIQYSTYIPKCTFILIWMNSVFIYNMNGLNYEKKHTSQGNKHEEINSMENLMEHKFSSLGKKKKSFNGI